MRIALVSWESQHSIAVGGVAAHVTDLAAALARGGDEVHVITRQEAGQSSYLFVHGVHYHRCAYDRRQDFVADIENMCGAFTARIFEVEDFCGPMDVVHVHDWLTVKAGAWARQARGRRVVMTFHSTEYGRCGNWAHEGDSRRIRDREWEGQYLADRVLAVSNALRQEVMNIYATPPEKIATVYNGIDPHRFDGTVDQGKVKQQCGLGPFDPMVLFVGRMVWQKGPDVLLEAACHLRSRCPGARVVFVGDGDMRPQLERRSHELGLAHMVRFLGYRNGGALRDIYRAADVVCLPSRNEPFGIVILEAWSAGKPVVVTRSGGPEEIVWHGVTGLKTPLDAAASAAALGTLLHDPGRARRMGRNGRIATECAFSWDRIAEATREVYQSAIGVN